MAITEKSRHELYQRLEKILGPEEATTLMEHLPPVGWADVATKDDLRHLEIRLDAKIDVLGLTVQSEIANVRTEMANLATELHKTMRTNAYLTIGATAAIVGFFSTVGSLT